MFAFRLDDPIRSPRYQRRGHSLVKLRKLRDGGTQKAALSTQGTSSEKLLAMARKWPGLDGRDMVKEVTCTESYHWVDDAGAKWVRKMQKQKCRMQKYRMHNVNSSFSIPYSAFHVVAYDFGIKKNILRHLSSYGANVSVVPADATAEDVLAMKPDGIFLSNGPGDPAGLPYAVDAVRKLIESGVPIFGVCLGHQLIGAPWARETHRLKFGHHGGKSSRSVFAVG